MQTEIKTLLYESITVKENITKDTEILKTVNMLIGYVLTSLRAGGKIIFAGNGGSFADAQHLSAEFTSRFMFDRNALASIVLGANNSAISAMANDYGYDQVFSRELQAVGHRSDVFVPISTSGNSPNIIKAVSEAVNIGMKVVGFSGNSGGVLANLCSCIRIPSENTARIQECHITLGHILCEIVEREMFKQDEE
jgi:D-sedoheptulose 7-phosphate isomerase